MEESKKTFSDQLVKLTKYVQSIDELFADGDQSFGCAYSEILSMKKLIDDKSELASKGVTNFIEMSLRRIPDQVKKKVDEYIVKKLEKSHASLESSDDDSD
jgi:hypothetical protein